MGEGVVKRGRRLIVLILFKFSFEEGVIPIKRAIIINVNFEKTEWELNHLKSAASSVAKRKDSLESTSMMLVSSWLGYATRSDW